MRITKKLTNLEIGTIIERALKGDTVQIVKHFNGNTYECIEMEITEEGDVVETDQYIYLTPVDLISGEITSDPTRAFRPDDHWLDELIAYYGFKSRYHLSQLSGVGESTFSNMVTRNTTFDAISVSVLHRIASAVTKLSAKYDYCDTIVEMIDLYLEQ